MHMYSVAWDVLVICTNHYLTETGWELWGSCRGWGGRELRGAMWQSCGLWGGGGCFMRPPQEVQCVHMYSVSGT